MTRADGLRSTVTEDEFGGFRIVIPAARNWFLRLFLPVWLCGWAVGEIAVPWSFLSGKAGDAGSAVFLLVWLTFWTIGGTFALLALAWNWAGREVIVLTDRGMETRREIGPFSRSKAFELASIRGLRYAPAAYNPYAMGHDGMFRQLGIGGGAIAFDHQPAHRVVPETRRFGDGLSEIEAKRLILTIRERFKFPEGPAIEPLPVQHG